MVEIVKGDLLQAEQIAIAHQVNWQGVMGSGVARQIREKYPIVYQKYLLMCRNEKHLHGAAQMVYVDDNRIVFNLFGQQYYGYGGECYTSYDSLTLSMLRMCDDLLSCGIYEVALPYMIGCCRGGGDWDVVSSIIQKCSDEKGIDFYLYKLS